MAKDLEQKSKAQQQSTGAYVKRFIFINISRCLLIENVFFIVVRL
ncbi:MbeB family mobilization protein [Enterobacter intestinihominis]